MLTVSGGFGKIPLATDLAIKMSRRHRVFPVQQVLRHRLRDRREGSGKHLSCEQLV